MKSVGLNSASFAAFQTAFCHQTPRWCLWCVSYLCLILPGQFHDSLLPVRVFAPSVQAHLGIKVNMSHSSTAAVRSLWMMTDTASPPTQTGPLLRFWLLCGHVHQRREGGQAGRGEDGRCRPWCIVGPGAVCIHRYKNLPIYFLNRPQGNSASSSWEMVLVPLPIIHLLLSPGIPGRLELREDTIESLLSASCLLQLSSVVQACCSFLMKQLHPSNCLGIRSYADAQGCHDLQRAAHAYTMVSSRSVSPWSEMNRTAAEVNVAY